MAREARNGAAYSVPEPGRNVLARQLQNQKRPAAMLQPGVRRRWK